MPTDHNARCRAVGCQAWMLPWGLFCDRHWVLVPGDLKKLIEKHHRNRRRPSQVCQRFIDMAVKELLEFQTAGHFRPRDGEFEWDDAPPAPAGVDGELFPTTDVSAAGDGPPACNPKVDG